MMAKRKRKLPLFFSTPLVRLLRRGEMRFWTTRLVDRRKDAVNA